MAVYQAVAVLPMQCRVRPTLRQDDTMTESDFLGLTDGLFRRIEDALEDLRFKAGDQWVNIDVKESKGGKWYAAVSTFKPKQAQSAAATKKPASRDDDLDTPF